MARQEIVLGTPPTGLGGDPPRVASQKINAMMLELYSALGAGGVGSKMDKGAVLVADPNTLNNGSGGFSYTTAGNPNNPPGLNVGFGFFTIPGTGTAAAQIAFPLTSVAANKGRLWTRQCFAAVWGDWGEVPNASFIFAALLGSSAWSDGDNVIANPGFKPNGPLATNATYADAAASGVPANCPVQRVGILVGATAGALIQARFDMASGAAFYRVSPGETIDLSVWMSVAGNAPTGNNTARLTVSEFNFAGTLVANTRALSYNNVTGGWQNLQGELKLQPTTYRITVGIWSESTMPAGGTIYFGEPNVQKRSPGVMSIAALKASSGANSDIKSLSGLTTALTVAQGGTGGNTQATARSGLGLGSAAVAPIVGTVSQSSGTPTGAIVENGSNSNGTFTKFADGTMICSMTRNYGNVATSTVVGSMFVSSGQAGVSFSATFSSVPTCSITITSGNATAFATSATQASASALPTFYVMSPENRTQAVTVVVIAIGRWF